jgi:chromosome segregation ATPase
MKTIQEIKDAKAVDEGYKDWKDFEWNASENAVCSVIEMLMNDYAEQFRRLAKDAAFELGNANIQILKLEENIGFLAQERITALKEIKDLEEQLDNLQKEVVKLQNRKPFVRDVTFDPDPNDGKNSSHIHSEA